MWTDTSGHVFLKSLGVRIKWLQPHSPARKIRQSTRRASFSLSARIWQVFSSISAHGELCMALAAQTLSCLPHGWPPAVPKDEAIWRQAPSVSGLWHLEGGQPTGLGWASWPSSSPHVYWKPFSRRKPRQWRSPSGQIILVQGHQMQ